MSERPSIHQPEQQAEPYQSKYDGKPHQVVPALLRGHILSSQLKVLEADFPSLGAKSNYLNDQEQYNNIVPIYSASSQQKHPLPSPANCQLSIVNSNKRFRKLHGIKGL